MHTDYAIRSQPEVYYQNNLEDLSPENDLVLLEEIRKWHARGIKILFLPDSPAELIEPLATVLKEEGFLPFAIPNAQALSEAGDQRDTILRGFAEKAFDRLAGSPAAFVYRETDKENVMPFIASFLMYTDQIPEQEAIERLEKAENSDPFTSVSEPEIDEQYNVSDSPVHFAEPEQDAISSQEDAPETQQAAGPTNSESSAEHAESSNPVNSPVQKEPRPAKAAPEVKPETENIKKQSPETRTEESAAGKKTESRPAPAADVKPVVKTRVSIRTKLLVIISGLLVLSLGGVIFFATDFFRKTTERRVQSANLEMTEILAQKVQTELNALRTRAGLIASAEEETEELKRTLFENQESLLYVALVEDPVSSGKWIFDAGNESALMATNTGTNVLKGILKSQISQFAASVRGAFLIKNISPGNPVPLLALGFPAPGSPGRICLAVIDSRPLVESFQLQSTAESFMVDAEGTVIAHRNADLVLSATSLIDIPIVTMLLESPQDNGQRKYEHENKTYLGSFKKLPFSGLGIISTIDEEKAFEDIYIIQQTNLYILGIALTLSIILVFLYAQGLVNPIKSLVHATGLIEKGEYDIQLQAKSKDEVGVLTSSFSKMASGLQERERMKDAFGRFVNKEIAEKAMKGEIKLGGERKQCAIFFSDLRGFTAMSEKMTPEEVVEYLNEYFSAMVECVENTNGIVDKFIGDAIMATWGAVSSHGNDTENAVNAGLMMREALLIFNESNEARNKPIAKFGCGINTGDAISGQIGSERKLEYTVIGDAVNLASRIEALNKPFGTDVLISQDAYEEVKDIFKVEPMPAIKVKGKTEPQTIYAVIGRLDDPDCPDSYDQVRKRCGIDAPKAKMGGEFQEEKEEKYEVLE